MLVEVHQQLIKYSPVLRLEHIAIMSALHIINALHITQNVLNRLEALGLTVQLFLVEAILYQDAVLQPVQIMLHVHLVLLDVKKQVAGSTQIDHSSI